MNALKSSVPSFDSFGIHKAHQRTPYKAPTHTPGFHRKNDTGRVRELTYRYHPKA